MTKKEFILRAASSAPALSASYNPDYAKFVNPIKNKEEKENEYTFRRLNLYNIYKLEYDTHKTLTWPLFYAEQLAQYMENENPDIFNS